MSHNLATRDDFRYRSLVWLTLMGTQYLIHLLGQGVGSEGLLQKWRSARQLGDGHRIVGITRDIQDLQISEGLGQSFDEPRSADAGKDDIGQDEIYRFLTSAR
jgi:hypothetical protein